MKTTPFSLKRVFCLLVLAIVPAFGQSSSVPAPLGIPQPGSTNDAPYAPQPILQGGIVIPLYPPDSPQLKQDRVREAEHYNLSKSVPGRINSITNIHNPSIEVHTVDGGINTGAAIILGGWWTQHVERRFRERGFRSLLLQLRREHDHSTQSSAP